MTEKIKSIIREPGVGGRMLSILYKDGSFVVVQYIKRVIGYTVINSYVTLEDAVSYVQSALDADETIGMIFSESLIAESNAA